MFKEFKEFAVRGNVVDMAVGIIIGAAFGTVAKSIVNDIIMPPIGLLLGNADFSDLFIVLKSGTAAAITTLEQAKTAGAVTLNLGIFINSLITFLIVAFAVFLLVKGINQLKRKQEVTTPPAPNTKDCQYCLSSVNIKAAKCPYCTSSLG